MKKIFAASAAAIALGFATSASAVDFDADKAAAGEAVYNNHCAVCHVAGVADAPKLDDAAAWAPRLALGLDALQAVTLSGKGAMPPRGTAASDEAAINGLHYMLKKVQGQ